MNKPSLEIIRRFFLSKSFPSLSHSHNWAKLCTTSCDGNAFYFSTFRGRNKKEKFEDFDNKHLYWNINNMKEEHLKTNNNSFANKIEREEIEEQISDIVGTENFIPENEQINEQIKKKHLFKKEISHEKEKMKQIKKIFNPSLKVGHYNRENEEHIFDYYQLKKKMKENQTGYKETLSTNYTSKPNEMDTKDSFENMENMKNMEDMKNINGKCHVDKEQKENLKSDNNCFIYKKMKKLKCSANMLNSNPVYNSNYKTGESIFSKKEKYSVVTENEKQEKKGEELKPADDTEYDFPDVEYTRNKKNGRIEPLFDYESFKNRSMYQDLTHEEYKQMQNLYVKKCDLDRKIRWFKMSDILNPMKEAKSIINALKVSEDDKNDKRSNMHFNNGENGNFLPEDDIKPFYENDAHVSDRIGRLCEKNQYDEIVSRIRMKIRKEKMENSKIIKEKIPNVARNILDPIKFHVNRRRVRVEKLLHTHLEQLINCNNSYFKYYLLNGLFISIHHLEMKTPRSMCKIVYSLLNKNIQHEDIKEKLDKVAFILRRLLARKLQLGYTPPLQFVPLADQNQTKIKHLQYYKLYSKYKYPFQIDDTHPSSSKLIDYYTKDMTCF